MEDIMFDKGQTSFSLGRNGVIITTGIAFADSLPGNKRGKETSVFALTSKGIIAKGYITIPNNKSPFDAIDCLMERKDLLPLLTGIHPLLDTLIAEKLKE